MKGLRTMIVLALAVGLMLTSVGSPLAQESTNTTANVFGEVIAKDQRNSNEAFIEFETKQGNVMVQLAANTQYKNANLEDVVAGKKVALIAEEVNSALVAKNVLVVPTEPRYKHLVGVVTSVFETTVNVGDEQGDIFAFNAQPIAATESIKAKPGQRVTAVIPKDLKAMKVIAVRITPAEAKTSHPASSTASQTSSETTGRVTCVSISPELVKTVCVEMPPQLSREVFIELPPEKLKEIWVNIPPELAKEIWLNLPPELAKEIWLSLPPEIKEIWIDLPPELAIEEIWLDINSQQLKQIWLNIPPELAKKIWLHLPTKDVKQIWIDLPTSEARAEATISTAKVESVTATPVLPEHVTELEELKEEASKR